MTTNSTVSAVDNPALANQLSAQALAQAEQKEAFSETTITPPSDPHVELLAGFQEPFGEFIATAEVRELNGADEEAVARVNDLSKGLMLILERAVTKLGDKKPDKDILDALLAGDRELLLLAIRKQTFGSEVTIQGAFCEECPDEMTLTIDLDKDVKMKKLEGSSAFDVACNIGSVKVHLPTGNTQKQLVNSGSKTAPELDSIVLKSCVLEINGQAVLDPNAILKLSVKDRRTILTAISERNPGPQLSSIKKDCPNCGREVPLPLTLADLFQS